MTEENAAFMTADSDQVKCANCWHPRAAHSRSVTTPVHGPSGGGSVYGLCAATVQGGGYSYPCSCGAFVDSRYVKVIK